MSIGCRAEWGDQIIVHVTNSMQYNGTTIHFHGVRQLHTPGFDGVPGLTECPLAPGQTRTYGPFLATQFDCRTQVLFSDSLQFVDGLHTLDLPRHRLAISLQS